VEGSNEPSGSIKYWEVLGIAAQLAASQEGLSSMKLLTSALELSTIRSHITKNAELLFLEFYLYLVYEYFAYRL
jgi:hypothetical protein